jgi:hypothetical protein
MSRFTITIAPDTDADGDRDVARGVIRVDSSQGRLLVTEFTLVAANGADLSDQRALRWAMNTLARLLSSVTLLPLPVASTPAPTAAAVAEGLPEATVPNAAAASHSRAKTRAAAPGRRPAGMAPDPPEPANGTRPYRRMPAPEAVMAMYRKAGSIAAMATRFDVPQHTAAHWTRKLRAMGHQIGRA